MSKKRTAVEANNDEPTNEGSDLLQQGGNAKRAKLNPVNETTLKDLPIQFLERILAEAVATEVKGMKLAKRVWKEKVDPVINRLKNVSSRWSSVLSTQAFRNEVDRILDDTAQGTIRLEIVQESWMHLFVHRVTAMKEEIFMLCRQNDETKINVYDRNNLAEVKDVIALPGTRPVYLEACNVSNCLYVSLVGEDMEPHRPSVLRITKDDEHKFHIAPWICDDLRFPFCCISAFPNGMLAVPYGEDPSTVGIYDASGSLVWSADIHGFKYFVDKVIQKSNGNLLLTSLNGDKFERVITEIDRQGKIVRQYKSSLPYHSCVSIADIHGRILISEALLGRIELLDSELNLLDFAGQRLSRGMLPHQLYYDRERNEVMGIWTRHSRESFLTIFRFVEE